MKKLLLYISILFVSTAAFAQTEEMLLPTDLKQQTIITEPPTLNKGFLRVGLIASYQVSDKYFYDDGKKDFFSESVWATSWGYAMSAEFGITNRLTAGIHIPYNNELRNYYIEYTDPGSSTFIENSWDLDGHGLGDIVLSARYQILTATQSRPSITGALDFTFPTGEKNPTNIVSDIDHDLPTGYGAFSINSSFIAKMIRYPFSYTAYANYQYHLPGSKYIFASDTVETDFTFGNRFEIGGSINFHLNDWIAVTNDLSYSHVAKEERDGVSSDDMPTHWGVSYETRMVFQIKRIRLAEAVRIPIKGKNFPADPLYVILLQYTF